MTPGSSANDGGVERINGPAFLPGAIREARRPVRAVLTAWALAFFPSLLLAALVGLVLPEAQQPEFRVDGIATIALLVIFAPIVETLIMGSVLLVLLRFLSPPAAIAASAAGWGIAHSLIAAAWGLVIWWPFLVFSTIFVAWRRRSIAAAFALAALVHGLHNLPSAIALALGWA